MAYYGSFAIVGNAPEKRGTAEWSGPPPSLNVRQLLSLLPTMLPPLLGIYKAAILGIGRVLLHARTMARIVPQLPVSSWLALSFSIVLIPAQLLVPRLLLRRLPDILPGLAAGFISISSGVLLACLRNCIWVYVTVALDDFFHSTLLGQELSDLQQDAARRCESLDTFIRIFMGNLVVVFVSLVLALRPAIGTVCAVLASFLLLCFNFGLRLYTGQGQDIQRKWLTIGRTEAFNAHKQDEYEVAKKKLREVRIAKEFIDQLREIFWLLFVTFIILLASLATGSEQEPMQSLNYVTEILSASGSLDKLLKCAIPAQALLNTFTLVQEGRLSRARRAG